MSSVVESHMVNYQAEYQYETKRNFLLSDIFIVFYTHIFSDLLPLTSIFSFAIMMNTPTNSNTSRDDVPSANTGKLNAKFTSPGATAERVGTRHMTKSASSSPFGVVSTASSTTASSTLSSPALSTSTMASSMVASRSHSTSPSHESAHPRALVFSEPLRVLPKEAYLIDFTDPEDVKTECMKYLNDPANLPRGQENQLSFLVMKFKAQDMKLALVKWITIVGGLAPKAFHPIATTKASIGKDFLCLIYDHKSMMIDTDVSSYR